MDHWHANIASQLGYPSLVLTSEQLWKPDVCSIFNYCPLTCYFVASTTTTCFYWFEVLLPPSPVLSFSGFSGLQIAQRCQRLLPCDCTVGGSHAFPLGSEAQNSTLHKDWVKVKWLGKRQEAGQQYRITNAANRLTCLKCRDPISRSEGSLTLVCWLHPMKTEDRHSQIRCSKNLNLAILLTQGVTHT